LAFISTDTNVKAVANRATWLGNDETHYEKKYEQLDIKHLKELNPSDPLLDGQRTFNREIRGRNGEEIVF